MIPRSEWNETPTKEKHGVACGGLEGSFEHVRMLKKFDDDKEHKFPKVEDFINILSYKIHLGSIYELKEYVAHN